MKNYMQHGNVDCLEHSLYVSLTSYLVCRRMGLDCRSAARGGLLHDFFLYDWHVEKPRAGLHGLVHPGTALRNANSYFSLNAREHDVIGKHMWPLTITPPKYKETLRRDRNGQIRALYGNLQYREKEKPAKASAPAALIALICRPRAFIGGPPFPICPGWPRIALRRESQCPTRTSQNRPLPIP